MNIKKQYGHDRCNGVSGVLIFDNTKAIIENCLYSNGASIANVCGNSKCEATKILTELYYDVYDSPTDRGNNSLERYFRNNNTVQQYFMLWKNSNCEYRTFKDALDKSYTTYYFNLEDSNYVNNSSTWQYVERIAKDYWHEDNNIISNIYQDNIVEKGSVVDFPSCIPNKVYTSTSLYTNQSEILIDNINSIYLMHTNANEEEYTACVQFLNNDNSDVDLNNFFVIWSSFLYTDGNQIKWSKYPNVIFNVDIRVNITSINYNSMINMLNNDIPKNLNGHTLTVFISDMLYITKPIIISGFFNGQVILTNGGGINYTECDCGVKCSNIQYLTIRNLTINNSSRLNEIIYNSETTNNTCIVCENIDNLVIQNSSFNNILKYNFDDISNSNNITALSINAGCLDNIKKSNVNKTVCTHLINCKSKIINTNFINGNIGIYVDQNSNVFFEKENLNDYCVFKNTLANKSSVYKMIGCLRIPMIMFYITGNSKATTNLKYDSPIKYNDGDTNDKEIINYDLFFKNENFILNICDPGSLFDHDYSHPEYFNTNELLNNSGEFPSTDGIIFWANKKHYQNIINKNDHNNDKLILNNNVKEMNNVVFNDSNVTIDVLNRWSWYICINPPTVGWKSSNVNESSLIPLYLTGLTYQNVESVEDNDPRNDYCNVMIMNNGSLDNNGIGKSEYVL